MLNVLFLFCPKNICQILFKKIVCLFLRSQCKNQVGSAAKSLLPLSYFSYNQISVWWVSKSSCWWSPRLTHFQTFVATELNEFVINTITFSSHSRVEKLLSLNISEMKLEYRIWIGSLYVKYKWYNFCYSFLG